VRDAARSAELFFRLDRAHRRGVGEGPAAAAGATPPAASSAGGAADAAEAGDAFRRLDLE